MSATFVLVHGAWHDAGCWTPLVPLLENLGHRVLAPNLPGHGDNSADIGTITLTAYARYLAGYLENADDDMVLVGHSMSGMVIAQAAEDTAARLRRLVFLSAYLPCDGQSLFDLVAANRGDGPPAPVEMAMVMSADKRTCTIAPESIRPLFYNRCPEGSLQVVPTTFPPQATLPLAGKVQLSPGGFGALKKSYLCCSDDRVIPVSHQRRMLKLQACDEMLQLDADHSPFLSCPETLAAILHSVSMDA